MKLPQNSAPTTINKTKMKKPHPFLTYVIHMAIFFSPLFLVGHPHFFNQLSNGLDIVSMAGEWLTATANTNMFTYEIAPVFILMENECLTRMREIIGFTSGDSTLAPGQYSAVSQSVSSRLNERSPKSEQTQPASVDEALSVRLI